MRWRLPWPGACLALLLPLSAAAQDQWSGSLVAASDERFRGRSLTGEHPSLRATLAYDHASGFYAGGSLANASFDGTAQLALVAYGGAGGALAGALRWDAGLTASTFAREREYDYAEAYLGVIGERWGLRLSYSPDYYGVGAATLYAEALASWPLAADWQLQLHLGTLRRTDGRRGQQADARLTLAWDAAGAQWQLAATSLGRGGPFPVPAGEHRQRWVASVALPF